MLPAENTTAMETQAHDPGTSPDQPLRRSHEVDGRAVRPNETADEMSDEHIGIPNMMFTMVWQALLLAASIGLIILAGWAAFS